MKREKLTVVPVRSQAAGIQSRRTFQPVKGCATGLVGTESCSGSGSRRTGWERRFSLAHETRMGMKPEDALDHCGEGLIEGIRT